jgi:predicted aspartyl protease
MYAVKILKLVMLLLISLRTAGQDMQLLRTARKVDLPFTYINRFIVIDVLFNGSLPLKFILDTGAENTILTQKEIAQALNLRFQRKIAVYGADMSQELTAYLISGVRMDLGGQLVLPNRSMLVLEEDYFRFAEIAGVSIHGIIGADILKRFVMQINYQRQIVTFYDPNYFQPPREHRATSLPVVFHRHKPYLQLNTQLSPTDSTRTFKFLIDTGASLSLLLHTTADSSLSLPGGVLPANIGIGLGGYLQGAVGRISGLQIAGQSLTQVIAYFQERSDSLDTDITFDRDGLLGNQLLERFELTIDYPREHLYVSPGRRINQRFRFDRSGMSLLATGRDLRTLVVMNIIPGSPADLAGLKSGDVIKSFNGWGSTWLELGSVVSKLMGQPGRRIRMKIRRNEQVLSFSFQLRELI